MNGDQTREEFTCKVLSAAAAGGGEARDSQGFLRRLECKADGTHLHQNRQFLPKRSSGDSTSRNAGSGKWKIRGPNLPDADHGCQFYFFFLRGNRVRSSGCSLFVGNGRNQRPDCPGCPSGGNPLVVIVRKAALEIGLELRRTAAHIPGAVLALRVHQKLHALLIDRIGRRQNARLFQRVERLPVA